MRNSLSNNNPVTTEADCKSAPTKSTEHPTGRIETVADRELRELEHHMDAYDRGEMKTVPQAEVYERVMASICQ